GGQQHRAVHAGAAAAPGVRADDDQVDRVGQFGAVVPLELDPLPRARAGLAALHPSPSQPSVTAWENAASSAAGSLTSVAVVSRSRGPGVIAAPSLARRSGYGSMVRSSPSAYSSSKQNRPTGTSCMAWSMPCLRRRSMTSPNGLSSSV